MSDYSRCREAAESLRTAALTATHRLSIDACQDVTRPVQRLLRKAVDQYDADIETALQAASEKRDERIAALREAEGRAEGETRALAKGIVQDAFSRWHARDHDDVVLIEHEIMVALELRPLDAALAESDIPKETNG